MPAIGFKSFELNDYAYLLDGQGAPVRGSDALIASGQTSAETPNHRIPPGTVVVKKTGDGKYYLANDATNGDRNTAPAKSTTSHTDGNGVIKLVGNHGTISVTTTTGTGTEANNATDLNADAAFENHYIATSGGGELTITARNPSREEWFYIHTDTMATAPFTEGQANEVQGTDADYRVTSDWAELKDINAVAQDWMVSTLTRGNFRTSALADLTAEARAVLGRRGSTFG